MSKRNRIVELRDRLQKEQRPQSAPKPLTEVQIRRIVAEEVAKLPRLRLELPARRGGCC